MRIFIITLLLLIICPLTATSFADEKSDCMISCSNDKRGNDMYCPPAGGYSDEDHKQCVAKNIADYNNCMKTCSPPVNPSEDQQSTSPPTPAEEPASTDKTAN